jgi:hypothetical protein
MVVGLDQGPNGNTAKARFELLHNRTVISIVGDRSAIEGLIFDSHLDSLGEHEHTTTVAHYIHAKLTIKIIPNIASYVGHTEIMIAGIEPLRHVTAPKIYYLDSKSNFDLVTLDADAALAGDKLVAQKLITDRDIAHLDKAGLTTLAKECFTASRLRWPSVIGAHLKLAYLAPHDIKVYDL